MKKMKKIKICPSCKQKRDMTYPAISRRDNKTEICSNCGTVEALEDFIKFLRNRKKGVN